MLLSMLQLHFHYDDNIAHGVTTMLSPTTSQMNQDRMQLSFGVMLLRTLYVI